MMRRLILAIIFCILLIRDSNCAVTIPPSNVFFRLTDKLYNKWVLDSNGDIVAWSGQKYQDQLWHAIDSDGTWFRLENKATGNYLTAWSDGNIFPFSAGKYDDQLWSIYTPMSDGMHFRLKNKYRGTVLVTQNGNKVFAYGPLHQDQFYRFDYDIDWNTCQSVGYQFINENNRFPIQAVVYKAEYINNGPIQQSTQGVLQLKKCETNTVQTTQETNWNVGVEASAGFSAFGADVSVSVSFNVGGSFSKTVTKQDQVCNTVSVSAPTCPSHYKCVRTFTISKIPDTTKQIKVTLNCGGTVIDWYGSLKVSGGAQVTFFDTFHPSGCFEYYSDIYNDRVGKLPFCESCTSSSFCNHCESGSAASVLIHISNQKVECITNHACDQYCGGQVKGDATTGYYCDNPDVTKSDCNWHLTHIANVYSDAHALQPNFIYPDDNIKFDQHSNLIIGLFISLLCAGIAVSGCLLFKKSRTSNGKVYKYESDDDQTV